MCLLQEGWIEHKFEGIKITCDYSPVQRRVLPGVELTTYIEKVFRLFLNCICPASKILNIYAQVVFLIVTTASNLMFLDDLLLLALLYSIRLKNQWFKIVVVPIESELHSTVLEMFNRHIERGLEEMIHRIDLQWGNLDTLKLVGWRRR